jgi:hypothetical protein
MAGFDGIFAADGAPDAADQPFAAPYLIVDGLLAEREAAQLRAEIDDHFAEPHRHRPDLHQVWNYWYVPDLYTYLRTEPQKVIAPALVARFHAVLTLWARETLGLGHVSWPNLSLYVDGCEQGLHNDSANGRFGYVYSLTRNARKTIGGETILLHEGDLFRDHLDEARAGSGLYDLVAPDFNRLTLFDDRLPHGVRRVAGSMDPAEGRIVLHGHISEDGPSVEGALTVEEIAAAVAAGLVPLCDTAEAALHGPLVLRLSIGASGRVERLRLLVDRVARSDGGDTEDFIARLVRAAAAIRFPTAAGPSEATLPLLLGGPLEWMRKGAGGAV